MDSTLRLLKYSLNKDSESLLVDFATDSYSFGVYKDFFIKDFLNINVLFPGTGVVSEFTFRLETEELKIAKHHNLSQVEFFINGEKSEKDFFKYISERYNIDLNQASWQKRLVNAQQVQSSNYNEVVENINSGIKILEPENKAVLLRNIDNITKALQEGKTEEDIKKVQKIIDLEEKIQGLEKEIEAYQNSKSLREEHDKKVNSLANEKKIMLEKNESVKQLVESKKKILEKIDKLKINNSTQIPESVKQQKIRNRIDELKKLKKRPLEEINTIVQKNKKLFQGMPLVGLGAVQIFVTAGLYLIAQELNLVLVGLMSFFTLVVAIYILNSNQSSEVSFKAIAPYPIEDDKPKPDENEKEMFINSAILNALNYELSTIDHSIKVRLGDKSLDEFQKNLNEFEVREAELNNEYKNLSSSLTPEEYYKKRRELDILKIEMENLEYTKDGNVDKASISNLLKSKQELDGINDVSRKAIELIKSLPVLFINLSDQSLVNNIKSAVVIK